MIRRESNTPALRSTHWASLEALARERIQGFQGWLQGLLEEEVTEFLGPPAVRARTPRLPIRATAMATTNRGGCR